MVCIIQEPVSTIISRPGFEEQVQKYKLMSKLGKDAEFRVNKEYLLSMEEAGKYVGFSVLDGERTAGFAGYIRMYEHHLNGDAGVMESLWVDPEYRRQAGQKLMLKVLHHAKQSGIKVFYFSLPYGVHPNFGRLFKPANVVYAHVFKR